VQDDEKASEAGAFGRSTKSNGRVNLDDDDEWRHHPIMVTGLGLPNGEADDGEQACSNHGSEQDRQGPPCSVTAELGETVDPYGPVAGRFWWRRTE
jgi:hypothetical protein